MNLSIFEKNIGYTFQKKEILENALTHTSYAYENNVKSNEKLEFLGDSILEFVTSEYLFLNYEDLKEGEMTKVRAQVVCEESLYKIAKKHDFSDFLNLGKSERTNKEQVGQAILADSVEAVIAAIFLDGGIGQARDFIINNLKEDVDIATKNVGMKDYKTVLQEKLQEKGEISIQYETIKEEGPDHNKVFTVQVKIDGQNKQIGTGKSKKQAEMEAAKNTLNEIKKDN